MYSNFSQKILVDKSAAPSSSALPADQSADASMTSANALAPGADRLRQPSHASDAVRTAEKAGMRRKGLKRQAMLEPIIQLAYV